MISYFFFFFIALFLGFLYNPKRKHMTRKALFPSQVSCLIVFFCCAFYSFFFLRFCVVLVSFFFTRLVFFNYGICQGCNRSLYYIYKHIHTYISIYVYTFVCMCMLQTGLSRLQQFKLCRLQLFVEGKEGAESLAFWPNPRTRLLDH